MWIKRIEYVLICDLCKMKFYVRAYGQKDKKEVEKIAKEHGYIMGNGKHFCAFCRRRYRS